MLAVDRLHLLLDRVAVAVSTRRGVVVVVVVALGVVADVVSGLGRVMALLRECSGSPDGSRSTPRGTAQDAQAAAAAAAAAAASWR